MFNNILQISLVENFSLYFGVEEFPTNQSMEMLKC